MSAILPNGRVVWLNVEPSLASAATVNRVGLAAEHAAHWRRATAARNSRALTRLSREVREHAERLNETRLERTETLRDRIVAGDHRMDRRVAKAIAAYRTRIARQLKIERESVGRLARRDFWDKVVLITSFWLFAAYGQRRLLGANNIALTIALLIWLVGDEVSEALFGTGKPSPYPLRDADAWSYIAPIGNLLAGWWLLSDFQHERFVAGQATIPADAFTAADVLPAGPVLESVYTYEVRVSGFVAPAHAEDFKSYSNVPAVAAIRTLTWSQAGINANARVGGLTARVDSGELILTFTAFAEKAVPAPEIVASLEISWLVDTAEPVATN